jgi:hypothetical protein
MDDRRFDDAIRTFGDNTTRRRAIGLLGSALAAFLGAADGSAEPKRNKKKKKRRGDRPDPAPTCRSSSDCNACRTCANGRCVADADREGFPCEDCHSCRTGTCLPDAGRDGEVCTPTCLRCWNGVCAAPDDGLCPDEHRCRNGSGDCCRACVKDVNGLPACCNTGEFCLDPGALSPNQCINRELNEPCGDNGDGSFSDFCPRTTQRCVGGECRNRDECPEGSLTASGVCCPADRKWCGEKCCFAGDACCDGLCKDVEIDPRHCGACGNACDPRTERCHHGQCRDRCSLNSGYTEACDDGVNYWCCHPDFATCCYDGDGDPHCCPS